MTDDSPRPGNWKSVAIGSAMALSAGVGNYIATHWGGVTADQLKAVKDDVAAVAAKQQSSDDVDEKNHKETKAQIAEVSDKVDKLTAVVSAKKRKVRSEP